MKSLKTPLRYPGGKSRATKFLLPKFPKNFTEYREPFLGGGSVAIAVAKEYPDIPVWVNDLYNPLYTFWCVLRDHPEALHLILRGYKEGLGEVPNKNDEGNCDPIELQAYYDRGRILFMQMKTELNHSETYDIYRAAAFYTINKCSFSGLTESSSFSGQASVSNFSMRGIDNLLKYSELIQDWKITNDSYESMLDATPETFIYLDPPYDIKDNLYGKMGEMHKKFDHDLFARSVDSCSSSCLVSYNSSLCVRDRFIGNWGATTYELTYTMRSVGEYMNDQKDRAELLLFNYDV